MDWIFFDIYLFWESMNGGGAERGRHRIQNRFQALSYHHRARRRAQTHGLWDIDLSQSRPLNLLSHPGAPPSPLKRGLLNVCPLFYWIFIFLLLRCKSFLFCFVCFCLSFYLHILDKSCQIYVFVKTFLSYCGMIIHLLHGILFQLRKFYILLQSNLSFFFLLELLLF